MKRETGFTVIELLIVVLIAAVLAAIGGPAMGNFIKNNRLQSKTHAVMASVLHARGEAVTRKKSVVMCRSANSDAGSPTCGGSAQNWGTGGYITFVDEDANFTFGAGDLLLRRGAKATDQVTLMTNGTADQDIRYSSDGTLNEGGNTAMLAVCDDRPDADGFGRRIDVPPHGRPRIIAAITDCTP
jgi:type IV fimbrial biogenesis protein FimT